MSRDRRNQWICMLLVVCCVLAALPFVEMGVVDDWSYAYTARKLAETGHLTYNGWAAFPLGAQAYWGALWIRVFGFSFTLLRLSMLPFAMGCAWSAYALLRHTGVGPNLSLLGTLSFVLSPLFLPCAASFMSDVPSLFLYLLAIYGYARAASSVSAQENDPLDGETLLEPPSGRATPSPRVLPWLLFATFIGLLGTTIRQTNWLVPLVCLPYLAWLWRDTRKLALIAGALWAFSALFGALYLRWYKAQPYSVPESLKGNLLFVVHHPGSVVQAGALLTLMLALLALPALAGSLLSLQSARAIKRAAWGGIAAFAAVGMLWCARTHLYAPWNGGVLTINGVYGAVMVLGLPPRVLSPFVCALLSLLAFVLSGLTCALLLPTASRKPQATAPSPDMPRSGTSREYRLVTLHLLLLTTGVYALLACTRLKVYDRYLLPVIPVAIMGILLAAQQRRGDRVGRAGWLLTALFAVYGVAGLHDYFAMDRARVAAVAQLTREGVPSTQIMAGFDFDGWTQLAAAGHVNNPFVVNPPDAYHKRPDVTPPIDCPDWLYDVIPTVQMRYLVLTAPQPALKDTRLSPIAYTAWLPPFQRQVFVQQAETAYERDRRP